MLFVRRLPHVFVMSVLLLLSVAAVAAEAPYRVERFDAAGLTRVEVDSSGGSIELQGGDGTEAVVEMWVEASYGRASERDIQQRLKNYEIVIARDGSVLRALARSDSDSWKEGLNISFRVQVPRQVASDLHTSGGSLTLSDVSGEHRLDTSGGSIRINQVSGTTLAKTSGGSIGIEDYQGVIDADTSGGQITAERGKGRFDLQTSGGSIRLRELDGPVSARTSGGSIDAVFAVLSDALTLHTSGGSVKATVPARLGLNLRLSGNRVHVALENFSGTAEEDQVNGTMNGGGVAVDLRTSGGSVTLSFAE